jgi:2-(1,2-epoxy-1,2-dihydrophenyl)acetyl-CoA isomerase
MTSPPAKEPTVAESVQYELAEGVATITLARPEAMNSLTAETKTRLREAVERAREDTAVRAVLLTGSGRAFSAGQDLREHGANLDAGRGLAGTLEEHYEPIVRALMEMPKPVVAAVNGVAAGAGASLAVACDVRLASDRASIGFTFNRIGVHPDWGASYYLPRLVGTGRAAELILSARMVDAAEAERIGLFQRVFAADEFEAGVRAFARELAEKPPLALSAAKHSLSISPESDVEMMMQAELEAQMRLFRSADVREGITAFNEKRKAVFRGE